MHEIWISEGLYIYSLACAAVVGIGADCRARYVVAIRIVSYYHSIRTEIAGAIIHYFRYLSGDYPGLWGHAHVVGIYDSCTSHSACHVVAMVAKARNGGRIGIDYSSLMVKVWPHKAAISYTTRHTSSRKIAANKCILQNIASMVEYTRKVVRNELCGLWFKIANERMRGQSGKLCYGKST